MENTVRYLEFGLGSNDYVIPLLGVREVISVPVTTPIPQAPDHFVGLMNLRGDVISIIDLRKKLSILDGRTQDEAVIIVDIGEFNVGIVVDSIKSVHSFVQSEMCEMPVIEHELNNKYIRGVFKKEKSLTVLLDISSIIDQADRQAINYQPENEKVAA